MASGTGGQIAYTRAGSLHHEITSVNSIALDNWRWTNFVSENLEHMLNELEEGAITGNKDTPPSHKGLDTGQGDINLEPNPDAFGGYLRAVFGQSSGTILCDVGSINANASKYGAGKSVYQHTFLPIQTNVEENSFLPAYHFLVYRDVGSAWLFQGSIVPEIEISLQAGQLAKAKANIMARSVTRVARTNSIEYLPPSKGQPWVWDAASIQVGAGPGFSSLAANADYESFNLTMSVPMEGVVKLDGTKKYSEFQMNEYRRVKISGSISFKNHAEYDAFIAYESRGLRITMTNVQSSMVIGNPNSAFYPTLTIEIPNMKYLKWNPTIGGPNRLIAPFEAKAERDVNSLYMISMRLVNVTSNY